MVKVVIDGNRLVMEHAQRCWNTNADTIDAGTQMLKHNAGTQMLEHRC
jgi:hypothetical protein